MQVYPRNTAAAVHDAVDLPSNFDVGDFANELTADTGVQLKLGGYLQPLAPVLDPRSDRVLSTRLQTFTAKVRRIHFETRLARGNVEVVGRQAAVSSTSNWDPLAWRRATVAWAIIAGSGATLMLLYAYVARHEWFARFGHPGMLSLLGCLGTACLGWLVSLLAMTDPTRSRGTFSIATAAVLACATAIVIAFLTPRPTVVAARAAVLDGVYERAGLAARALIDLDIDRAGGEAVLDQIQARLVSAALTCAAKVERVRYPWQSSELRKECIAQIGSCAENEARNAFMRGDSAALDRLAKDLGEFALAQQAGIRWMAAVIHAQVSLAQGKVDSATDHLGIIVTLLADIPQSMRLGNSNELAETAAALRQSLMATQSGSLRVRRQALIEAIPLASRFGGLAPVSERDIAKPLMDRLHKVRKEIARADLRAAERAKEAEEDDREPDRHSRSKELLNPY